MNDRSRYHSPDQTRQMVGRPMGEDGTSFMYGTAEPISVFQLCTTGPRVPGAVVGCDLRACPHTHQSSLINVSANKDRLFFSDSRTDLPPISLPGLGEENLLSRHRVSSFFVHIKPSLIDTLGLCCGDLLMLFEYLADQDLLLFCYCLIEQLSSGKQANTVTGRSRV